MSHPPWYNPGHRGRAAIPHYRGLVHESRHGHPVAELGPQDGGALHHLAAEDDEAGREPGRGDLVQAIGQVNLHASPSSSSRSLASPGRARVPSSIWRNMHQPSRPRTSTVARAHAFHSEAPPKKARHRPLVASMAQKTHATAMAPTNVARRPSSARKRQRSLCAVSSMFSASSIHASSIARSSFIVLPP